ncbi:hypothetical protein PanWU01x14_089410 [Parasponia andersonii]|uniref:Uncharacterized protein n=1 Tax=Parasponia andersonii TaxID=3476 RepID=A0A2P5D7K2_PARAD|nr:hypothetical protein PanWU01x14_089410 [Parasponia andersonii]
MYEEENTVQQELASRPQKRSYYGSHVAVDDPRKRMKRKMLCNKNLPADLKNARTVGVTSQSMTRENVQRGNCCTTQKACQHTSKTLYYGSHVARRRPKKTYEEETAVQQGLASRPQKRSYYGSDIARRRPEKTYEEETAVQ